MKINKQKATELLSSVSDEKAFWCHDGKIFHNLEECSQGMKEMSEDTFFYHVNEFKNDFSKWIAEIIGDYELSEQLANTQFLSDTRKKITARISFLKKIAK